MIDKTILVKTPQYEIDLVDLCVKECLKINGLLSFIEKEFNVSMSEHQELRHEILDISNFIKRIPNMVSEVM
jgi:hypothetical protein